MARLAFCKKLIEDGGTFDNVIFIDESTIEMQQHERICFRKIGEQRKLKPLPKHALKLHVWVGISKRRPMPILILKGS